MPEAYSKLCQISKMMRHSEKPGIVRIVQFIQEFSGIFRDTTCSDLLRDIKAYSGILEAY